MRRLRYDAAADAYVGEQVVVAARDFVTVLQSHVAVGTPLPAALQKLLDESVWVEARARSSVPAARP